MGAPFTIKQGALLALSLQFQQDDGTPVNITGATVQSQIRDTLGVLVATPTLTVTDAALGQVSYSALSDSTWPIGALRSDVYFSMNGVPMFTETFLVAVSAPITQLGG